MLLVGPSGCGKKLIIEWLARHLGWNFVSVSQRHAVSILLPLVQALFQNHDFLRLAVKTS